MTQVSVIISTYNRLHYLQSAVSSVLAQTFTDFELLVCDDASSEDVATLLQGFSDDRIRHLPSEENLGQGATNLRGYRFARGRYVAHLDDDDEWNPGFLETLVNALERHPECSLAFCDHDVIDGQGVVNDALTRKGARDWGRAQLRPGVHRPFSEIAVVHRSIPTSHCSVIRADALDLDSFDPCRVSIAWDLWMTYRASRGGAGAFYTPERHARYRIHADQSSVHAGQSAPRPTDIRLYEEMAFCDQAFLEDHELQAFWPIFARRFSETSVYWSVALMGLGRSREARRVLAAGLRTRFVAVGVLAVGLAVLPSRAGAIAARAATALVQRRRAAVSRAYLAAGNTTSGS